MPTGRWGLFFVLTSGKTHRNLRGGMGGKPPKGACSNRSLLRHSAAVKLRFTGNIWLYVMEYSIWEKLLTDLLGKCSDAPVFVYAALAMVTGFASSRLSSSSYRRTFNRLRRTRKANPTKP